VALSLLVILGLHLVRPGSDPLPGDNIASSNSRILKADHSPAAVPSEISVTHKAASGDALGLAAIGAETDPDHRSQAIDAFVASVSDADFRATLETLAHDSCLVAAELSKRLARRWAETNAPAAAAWASGLNEGPVRLGVFEQIAIARANSDLAAAMGWVKGLPPGGDSKSAAALSIGYEATRTDPLEALDLASGLSPTRERDDLLVHAISQWSAADSGSAAAWAMNVEDPSLRARLIGAVAIAGAEQDGRNAATLAVSDLVAGPEQDRAIVSIVERWAQRSPQAAASWVAQFPEVPSREAAVQSLLSIWVGQDAEAAGNWVRSLSPGTLRQVGTAALAQVLAEQPGNSTAIGTASNR